MYALPFLALFAPNLWVQFTFRKNDKHLSDMPFTGQEFGKKIIAQNELKNVEIESVKKGDYYDPSKKKFALLKTVWIKKVSQVLQLSAMKLVMHCKIKKTMLP